ncbi:MAG: hypothetical protein QM692_01515 [Thermomicrobiales bacterium]
MPPGVGRAAPGGVVALCAARRCVRMHVHTGTGRAMRGEGPAALSSCHVADMGEILLPGRIGRRRRGGITRAGHGRGHRERRGVAGWRGIRSARSVRASR